MKNRQWAVRPASSSLAVYSIFCLPMRNSIGGTYRAGVTVTVAGFPSKSVAVGTIQVIVLVATPGSVGTLMSLGQLENAGGLVSKQ